ncbi:MAG: hypothetical protein DRJ18_02235 [Candidatus Methanomethylicota archaeon]|nr:MAG: hypothetical protein DRJ18_02235 [Candidatus Verstraetearchaeota archaeon]
MPEIRVSIDKELHKIIRRILDEKGINWSAFINALLRAYLDKYHDELPVELQIEYLYYRAMYLLRLSRKATVLSKLLRRAITTDAEEVTPLMIMLNETKEKLADRFAQLMEELRSKLRQRYGESYYDKEAEVLRFYDTEEMTKSKKERITDEGEVNIA